MFKSSIQQFYDSTYVYMYITFIQLYIIFLYICTKIYYNAIIKQFYNSTNSKCRLAHSSGGWSGVVLYCALNAGVGPQRP